LLPYRIAFSMISFIFLYSNSRNNVELQHITTATEESSMKVSKLAVLAVASLATMAATAADLAGGEKLYNATCVACHGSGVLNAPKLGDKTAWAPRIKQGKPTLYKHALEGFKMMPAKGGNAALKDAEVQSAIDFMVSKSS
jgi:cytochrome c5